MKVYKKKEEEDEEIQSKAIWPFGEGWRMKSHRKSKKKLREIHCEEESSQWKEKGSFSFTQVVSLSVIISIQYSEIIWSLSYGFSLQE